MQIIKRCGREKEEFDKDKIANAIIKAGRATGYNELEIIDVAMSISDDIEEFYHEYNGTPKVDEVEEWVFFALIEEDYEHIAKAYEGYRAIRAHQRKENLTDESILGLIGRTNEDVMKENSNKNPILASTQRDLIAGEVSKDIARRKMLPPHIVQAHDEGVLHFHDADYFMSPIFNCCLINIGDMLDNGTVINERMIESPKSFQVACTVTSQIIAQVASSQYGGQSVAIKHLGKYLERSYQKYVRMFSGESPKKTHELATQMTKKELKDGIQTLEYQINTLMTVNGQSPFLTLFMEIDLNDPYFQYTAMIIEEILKQRLEGVKNEKGIHVTPSFPKLVYVVDEHNNLEGNICESPWAVGDEINYDHVTRLAVKCSSKRLYPDYISAKKMREEFDGQVFSVMGCRSTLSLWKDENDKYKFEGRFNCGVVSLNLPQIALSTNTLEGFYKLLDERLALCYEALMCRHNALKGTLSDVSPIHWQHGAIARLEKGQTIDHLLEGEYSTLSLGYIGLYEAVRQITGGSHTVKPGQTIALEIMNRMNDATSKWKAQTGLGFGTYGTPAESLCYRFARIDKEKFGEIKDITDKGYYTNSYHVDVREEIDAFSKLEFEAQFQPLSSGGAIS